MKNRYLSVVISSEKYTKGSLIELVCAALALVLKYTFTF